jgi:hypothetical protein
MRTTPDKRPFIHSLWPPKPTVPDTERPKRRLENPRIHHKTLQLLFYVLHPSAGPCLANHCNNFTTFSCENRESWVASITLRGWMVSVSATIANEEAWVIERVASDVSRRLRLSPGTAENPVHGDGDAARSPRPGTDAMRPHAFQQDDLQIQLPKELRRIWEKKVDNENMVFDMDVSSIVLSTNPFGDFSKCTIVTELFDRSRTNVFQATEEIPAPPPHNPGSVPQSSSRPTCGSVFGLADDEAFAGDGKEGDLQKVAEEARKLWQIFIHQPQTGRCLVFFLILGRLCSLIHDNFEEAINQLSHILIADDVSCIPIDQTPDIDISSSFPPPFPLRTDQCLWAAC